MVQHIKKQIAYILAASVTFSANVLANSSDVLEAPKVNANTQEHIPTTKEIDMDSRSKLMNVLGKIDNFQAEFVQVILDEEGNALQSSSGGITVSKPNLVNWRTLLPDENQIVSDGQSIWLFDPFIEQVTAYPLDTSLANTPILLLSSNDKILWDQYRITSLNDKTFFIIAKDENAQVKQLQIEFSTASPAEHVVILKFVILDATGQQSEIRLSKFEQNITIQSSVFEFTVPEGVYLDDQR